MYKIAYVILHYVTYKVTRDCIDSIINTGSSTSSGICYDIIVVDNASCNNSLSFLNEHYKKYSNIHFIKADSNLGFAKGNNLGYDYAVNNLHADFIIFANNDTLFVQPEFNTLLVSAYEDCIRSGKTVGVMGPDILNTGGFHQNPYRDHIITLKEVRSWIFHRRLWYIFLVADKYLMLSRYIGFFQHFYTRKMQKSHDCTNYTLQSENIVLHGSCLIITPQFTSVFRDYAFFPETFMYCEEDILAYMCAKAGINTLYLPELHIVHCDSISTTCINTDAAAKERFLTKNMLRSLKVLEKLIMSHD